MSPRSSSCFAVVKADKAGGACYENFQVAKNLFFCRALGRAPTYWSKPRHIVAASGRSYMERRSHWSLLQAIVDFVGRQHVLDVVQHRVFLAEAPNSSAPSARN